MCVTKFEFTLGRDERARVRILRRLGLVTAAIGIFLALGLWLVPRAHYDSLVEGFLVSEARKNDVRLNFQRFQLTGSSFSADAMQLFFPRLLLGVECREVALSVGAVALVRGAQNGRLTCRPYGGSLSAEWSLSTAPSNGTIRVEGTNIGLGAHPQLQGLGLSGGITQVRDAVITVHNHRVEEVSAVLAIVDLSRSSPFSLTDLSPSLLPFTIPAFQRLSLEGTLAWQRGDLTLRDLSVTSDWGDAKGSWHFKGQRREVSGKFEVRLSADGQAFLGSFLPLITNGALPSDSAHFELTISGRAALPTVRGRLL